jgi:hypothetical protein
MAASPDRATVVDFKDHKNIVASIEIKTRVSSERTWHAEKIQHKLISCEIGDDITWNECIEEHSTQFILQL